jgi:hypothetical protein
MGMKGQNTKSIRKKQLNNQRTPVVGIRNVKFHHQAAAGETMIDLNSLTLPSGFVNPSPAVLTSMNLAVLSENLILTSSIRPFLMEELSYEVRNNSIHWINGFTPLEGEIFTGLFMNNSINGTLIADVRTPGGSGVLLEDETDFVLGEAIPILEASSNQWPIQLYRGPSLTPVLRNVGNSPTGEGNYYMVDNGSGYCQVIRFNDAGNTGGEPVAWASHGALGERPSQSVLQYVDTLAGQLDKVITDLALVTDKDESEYQAAPNNIDLKQFGDLVFKLLNLEIIDKTPWLDFVPDFGVESGSIGTHTLLYAKKKQTHTDLEIALSVSFTSNGAGAGNVYMLLPEALSGLINSTYYAGGGRYFNNTLSPKNSMIGGMMFAGAPTKINFLHLAHGTLYTNEFLVGADWVNGRAISVTMKIPINGWSGVKKLKDLI